MIVSSFPLLSLPNFLNSVWGPAVKSKDLSKRRADQELSPLWDPCLVLANWYFMRIPSFNDLACTSWSRDVVFLLWVSPPNDQCNV